MCRPHFTHLLRYCGGHLRVSGGDHQNSSWHNTDMGTTDMMIIDVTSDMETICTRRSYISDAG